MRKRAQAAIEQPSAAAGSLRAQAAIKEPAALTRRLHAQAAMEFLMTYGWAILIMLVVIAVLFYLGIFSPSTSSVKSCILPSGLSCYDFDLDSSGNLLLDLGQATGRTITVTGVGCSANNSPTLTTLYPPVPIESGSHAKVAGVGGGATIVPCTGGSGGSFKGTVSLKYQSGGTSYYRTVTGSFSAPLINSSGVGGGGGSQTLPDSGVWVLVPGNPTYGTSDFYVMKYEAKQNSTNATSTAAGTPWVSLNQGAARTACTNVGGHLLSIAEAQTINRDVASVAGNWMSGSVGSGCMFGGHMQCSSGPCYAAFNASSDDGQGWWDGTADQHNTSVQNCPFTTYATNTWGNETRRTFYLSNGNVLWDWSGNVWEWMNDTCQQSSWYNSGVWLEWDNANLADGEIQAMGPPNSPPIWTYQKGVGRYYGCTVNGNAFWRGGKWDYGYYAGAFSLSLSDVPGYSNTGGGFRCARPG
ncbi:Uncharacterised protein [uncultured archaeon]|nr:Uncharacterised protein [uncultured archaeon]